MIDLMEIIATAVVGAAVGYAMLMYADSNRKGKK